MEEIQATLGVGKIYKHCKDSVQYRVVSIKELQVIVDHFDKNQLITQKLADLELFKQVVDLINRKEHLTIEGLQQIVNLRAEGLRPTFQPPQVAAETQ